VSFSDPSEFVTALHNPWDPVYVTQLISTHRYPIFSTALFQLLINLLYSILQSMDNVIGVNDIPITATIGLNAWRKYKPQLALFSVRLNFRLPKDVFQDNFAEVLDYRKIYNDGYPSLQMQSSPGFHHMIHLFESELSQNIGFAGWSGTISLRLPDAVLNTGGVEIEVSRNPDFASGELGVPWQVESICLKDISLPVIIGVNPEERGIRQLVQINVTLLKPNYSTDIGPKDVKWGTLPAVFDPVVQVC